ncbi:hypothetical protein QBC38DRAFT_43847 [Podospora fimiseda]|uniref:Galactose oxidase n=1 Tax=Podospora fimiseda TaxID=252190 RepID=A0AAN7GPA5_9PEZI|nr:hypothetical protein QBC38DRAFT_43847 [Podospora fimiseda]
MAGVVAGAIAAEQIIATGLEAAAAVVIAAPTQPLKVSLTQLPKPEGYSVSLARSHHTLTVLKNKAYIFGGQHEPSKLCDAIVHTLSLPDDKIHTNPSPTAKTPHTSFPALPVQDASGELFQPSPRAEQAACAFHKFIMIHGGRDAASNPIDNEENVIWLWNTDSLSWSKLRGDTQLYKSMAPRYGHHIFCDEKQGFILLVGGQADAESINREAWIYDLNQRVWSALPDAPGRPLAAAYTSHTLYIMTEEHGMQYLDVKATATEREKPLEWARLDDEPAPAPRPIVREGGALVPIATGHGREYLIYLFGGQPGEKYYSDIWALQLPSTGYSGAAIKDKIRDKVLPKQVKSGEGSWAEVEILPMQQTEITSGKVHPGPRGQFGAGRVDKGVVVWGGVNAKGETEGDGWVVRVATGVADEDRFE